MSNDFNIKVSITGEGYDSGFEIKVDRAAFGLEAKEEFEDFCRGVGETILEFLTKRTDDG